ncbi:MAG TPA: glutamate--tRNA ligase [Bacteroidetes bacterium]|nr:glutamate--tRNA ligase 1 [bacterium BMS3Bbin03]HDK36141.1 glutamate--tRNA ligase [Bacteroidota bacterium]
MKIRARFAPSPTGYLHVGNARTAILNWLFAKHGGGQFVLRVEDTDVERSAKEFEQAIYKDLRWLGLNWDEGPDVGGAFGPYRQSERLEIYHKYAHRLLEEGKAFHCYCTQEEIEVRNKAALARGGQPKYDGHCLHLTNEQKQAYLDEGRRPVIRFHVPEETIQFQDLVKGEIVFEGENISDFVILRSDGAATYNFAVVIDDALMKISHVIRGDDHLSNTPKQVLLFERLGFDVPVFVHIPMILGSDRSKLSKRHGITAIRLYREKGYLPEALVNYLSLLSWSSESGEEILPLGRLIKEFDFTRMSKSAAIFDREKLNWMNNRYIRTAALERIVELSIPFLEKAGFRVSDRDYLTQVIDTVRGNVDYLEQIPEHAKIFFQKEVSIESDEAKEMLALDSSKQVCRAFLEELGPVETLSPEVFKQIMKSIQKKTGVKGKFLWMPVRIALTGRMHGPELPRVVEILGKEKCESFIKETLGKQL